MPECGFEGGGNKLTVECNEGENYSIQPNRTDTPKSNTRMRNDDFKEIEMIGGLLGASYGDLTLGRTQALANYGSLLPEKPLTKEVGLLSVKYSTPLDSRSALLFTLG